MIIGKHAVSEALRAAVPLDTIYIEKGKSPHSFGFILKMAASQDVVVKHVPPEKIKELSQGENSQGILALEAAAPYSSVESMLEKAEKEGKSPFLLLTDGVQDPHNLGALIRSAECLGADGIIFPKRNNASLSPAVSKTSAGAISHIKIARVTNLVNEIKKLQKRGIWVYGADMEGTPVYEEDLSGPIALVIGSEGKGLHRLTKEACDKTLSIPMAGKINSLNAAAAGSIILYEISRQRRKG